MKNLNLVYENAITIKKKNNCFNYLCFNSHKCKCVYFINFTNHVRQMFKLVGEICNDYIIRSTTITSSDFVA